MNPQSKYFSALISFSNRYPQHRQLRQLHFWPIISNWYGQLRQLHFLTIWVVALAAWPDFILSNMQTFFTGYAGYSSQTSAACVNGLKALTGLFGIVGAMVLDGYLTHYGMIFFSSLFYAAGLFLLYIGTSAGEYTTGPYAIGFFVIAVGKSSSVSSAIALSGKQAPISLIEYFFKFTILMFVSSKPTSPIKKWCIQFFVASMLMFLVALVPLFYGKARSFRKPIGERRNPLLRMLCVYIAAFMKRSLSFPQGPVVLHEGSPEPEHRLEHTNGKRFLDKAAIRETSTRKWLCTVTEVEECKRLLHMVLICTAFLSYGLIYSIGDTFFLEQANQMDTTIGDILIPLQGFLILSDLSSLASEKLYKIFIWKRLQVSGNKYAPAIEYAMGTVLSTLCCAVASWVAMETLASSLASSSRVSVFWLTPQFIIFGAMEGLAGNSIEGFFSTELPSSMENYDAVFAKGIVAAGTVCAVILVSVTKAASRWFAGENIRWDKFYHLCSVLGISIFFGYSYAAVRYYCQDDKKTDVDNWSQHQEAAVETQTTQIEDESQHQEMEETAVETQTTQVEDESQQQEMEVKVPEHIIDMNEASEASEKWRKSQKLISTITGLYRKKNI